MHKSHYENVPFDVPESWAWARIIDICETQENKRPTGDTFRYIDIDAIDNKHHCVSAPKITKTSQAPSRAAKRVRTGDTLFSMVRPYLENIAFVTEDLDDCIASTGFYVCRPCAEIIFPRYLYYFLTSNHAISGINSYMRGDNSPSIRKDEMDSFLVPIPPKSEQERIAKLLDSTLVVVDDIDNQKNILSATVSAAKSKILSLAISGKLLPQDPYDEPASILLERIRAEREKLIKAGKIKRDKIESVIARGDDNSYYAGLPESWAICRLDDIGSTNIGLTYKPTDICDNGIPVLRSNNIKDGRLDLTELIRVNTPLNENLELNEGDILICARNGSRSLVGKCALVHGLSEEVTFGAFMAVYRSMCNRYIYYFLHTENFRGIFQSKGISTQINQLTQAMIRQTLIPLPPLEEQNRIVNAIETAFEQLDSITAQLS